MSSLYPSDRLTTLANGLNQPLQTFKCHYLLLGMLQVPLTTIPSTTHAQPSPHSPFTITHLLPKSCLALPSPCNLTAALLNTLSSLLSTNPNLP